MSTIAVDLDGTLDAFPHQMSRMLDALHAAAYYIVVISGNGGNPQSGETWEEKCNYLNTLGITAWDELVLVSGDVPEVKAQWCHDNGVSILIDNSIQNCKAALAFGIPLVLLPYATRVKGEDTGTVLSTTAAYA